VKSPPDSSLNVSSVPISIPTQPHIPGMPKLELPSHRPVSGHQQQHGQQHDISRCRLPQIIRATPASTVTASSAVHGLDIPTHNMPTPEIASAVFRPAACLILLIQVQQALLVAGLSTGELLFGPDRLPASPQRRRTVPSDQ
jgi:hypothetical protein